MSSLLPFPAPISAAELRHQLRTPLNHVIGFAEFLIEEYPAVDFTATLKQILVEANALLESIQQVEGTDGAALTALHVMLHPGAERIRHIVSELTGLMPAAAAEDLGRIASAATALQEVLVTGNAGGKGRSSQTPPVRDDAGHYSAAFLPGNAAFPPGDAVGAEPGRILVVDDDEMNRDMLLRQLARQRHEVSTAPDGPTALALLRERRFDIMLLDLMMPGMNGFEVLEAVKGDPALSGVAVILVSALDEMDSVVRSIEAGAEDYLFKPVNPTLLRARIKSTLGRLRAEEMVRRKQRLESIGLLAAGIAHDFNNLLTGILGYAQLLARALDAPKDREMADAILRSGERAAELTRQLLAYSGKGMFRMQPVNLASLICESEGLIHASLPKKVRLQLQLADVPSIVADENQIRQVLLNLVLNAVEAIGADGTGCVNIETGVGEIAAGAPFDVSSDEVKPGRYAWFEVSDTGCGMDPATVSKIFEPFFTTKFLGRGLGLAAVAGIVRSHKGLLRVTSQPGQGSGLRLYFPVQGGESPASVQPLVLVVDDESVVRQMVKMTLERAGRAVALAESGEQAIEILQRLPDRIKIALVDSKAAANAEGDLITRLRQLRPDLKIIVSSSFTPAEAAEHFSTANVNGYLQKPWRLSELLAILDQAASQGDFVAKLM
jgi:signal transduction histidine kinase